MVSRSRWLPLGTQRAGRPLNALIAVATALCRRVTRHGITTLRPIPADCGAVAKEAVPIPRCCPRILLPRKSRHPEQLPKDKAHVPKDRIRDAADSAESHNPHAR